jgi:SNF2 family DNA or RNA helicase
MAENKKIRLALSDDGKSIVMSGDLISLRRDARMWASLKRIDPGYDSAEPVVRIGDHETQEVLRGLHAALAKRGYSDENDDAADTVLDDFYREEEAFSEFSKKARLIRNNDCDSVDFTSFESVVARELPGRSLYPLQLLSAYHLAFSQNACNFSVPGAGKTTIVYGAYSYLRALGKASDKHIGSLVVVGPLSSFGPWEDEFESCFGRRPSSVRLDATMQLDKKKNYLLAKEPADITLVSYGSLAQLVNYLKAFLSDNRSMVVLDEAHKIKNTSGGLWATAASSIAKSASSRVVLTGTPAPNGYEDLYNLFGFIWPGRNVARFQVNQLAEMSKSEDDPRIPRLLEYIEPFYLRIRKSDLHLPPVDDVPLTEIEMSPRQAAIYGGVERYFLEPLVGADFDDEPTTKSAFAKIIRLMQAASDPSALLVPNDDPESNLSLPPELLEDIREYSRTEVPRKYEVARSIIEEVVDGGGKVIVWTHFVSTLKSLERFLEESGIRVETLYGETPTEDLDEGDAPVQRTRERIIREFNNPSSSLRVVIANPAAVAESISLHHACHVALYVERDFNAAQYLQSRDRIHRYGLSGDVVTTYYKLASLGTIDEVVDERLRMKEERMMRIVESSSIPLFDNVRDGLGADDIRALMRDYASRTNAL